MVVPPSFFGGRMDIPMKRQRQREKRKSEEEKETRHFSGTGNRSSNN